MDTGNTFPMAMRPKFKVAHLWKLRTVSALTRMGFLPRGGRAYIDVVGRWIRLVAEYGTVYLEKPGQSLGLA